jgi:hypothetical protein
LPGNRARLSFSQVRHQARERKPYLLAFEPDSERFELIKEAELEERDLVTEMEEFLTAHPLRTVKEISRSREAEFPGIGANQDAVRAELEANPDRFESLTGDAAKAANRHPTATIWKVTRPFESPESPSDSEVADEEGDLVTPLRRSHQVSSQATPMSPVLTRELESPGPPEHDTGHEPEEGNDE